MTTDQKEIAKYLLKLKHDQFSQRLNSAYGLPKSQVDPVIARIGFDGQENRLGWSPANLSGYLIITIPWKACLRTRNLSAGISSMWFFAEWAAPA